MRSHRGVELLPDARYGKEDGGSNLADVFRHRVDALCEVDGGAGVERIEDAEGSLGHVRERQEGELLIARAGLREEVGEADLEEDVAVAQHGALGRAGGARGVDEDGEILRTGDLHEGVESAGMLSIVAGAP